ncbi:MAG: DUF4880 domain-containing protein, partial [Steroidobacteraceae bacterium]
MNSSEEQIRDAIAQQAGEWFIANQSGAMDLESRTAFVTWLRASPVHVEEYLGVALVARDLAIAANDPAPSIEDVIAEARSEPAAAMVLPFAQTART